MQIGLLDISRVGAPLIVGVLFITSYFFSDKNEFFHWLAYFPRKREGSMKIGAVVFGAAFILIALYNCLVIYIRNT